MNAPPRLVPDEPFPPYRYVPGRGAHPMKHPDGYLYGRAEEAPPAEGTPEFERTHRYALDLFNTWRLGGPEGERAYPIHCAMWSNNGDALKTAAARDQGIALLPTFIVGDMLQSGELRTLLTGYPPSDIVLCAIYPRHRHLSTKVQLFVERLCDRFGDRPYWDLVE